MTHVPGLGTLVNTVAILGGATIGMVAGHRLSESTRTIVTDCLGLVTILMAAMSAASVTDPAFAASVGPSAPVLIVLGALVFGAIVGSALRLQDRLEALVTAAEGRLVRRGDTPDDPARERFVQGWLTSTLLFCVGPLTILGSLNDGLGRGIDQLMVKSALDFFASIAFASTFGVGVMCSAASVLVIQGLLTAAGVALGTVMPADQVAALTATGGLMLAGVGLRLLGISQMRVADMTPALVVAPILTVVVGSLM